MSSIGVDIGASHISCGLYNSEYDKLECKIYFPNKMSYVNNINNFLMFTLGACLE